MTIRRRKMQRLMTVLFVIMILRVTQARLVTMKRLEGRRLKIVGSAASVVVTIVGNPLLVTIRGRRTLTTTRRPMTKLKFLRVDHLDIKHF